ncbi:transposase [Candidatus Pacebacteria bacterium]|nr:transposase [Candidatus Paceibacterota bacterium]
MEFYHIVNRGVEKRKIVHDAGDRIRFVSGLFTFNDRHRVANPRTQPKRRHSDGGQRELLVHIHAWCLMNNHYHILLSPINDDISNISLFMKKLNMGYAKFFNEKYKRSGYLWQGRYKKIHIQTDSHFMYIPYYIHLNPLDCTQHNWREGTLSDMDMRNALNALENYRWSSYLDYNESTNFPSIITKSVLTEILGNSTNQLEIIKDITTSIDLGKKSLLLEI